MILPSLTSVRGRIFIAFFAMSAITGGLGAWGTHAIRAAGRVVVDTYDRPLMAINFARAASLDFSQMENEALRQRGGVATPQSAERLERFTRDCLDDLAVAAQRSLTAEASALAHEVQTLVEEWSAARRAHRDAELEPLASHIIERFDRLIEQVADDSFVERRRSVASVDTAGVASIAATLLAAALSLLLTLLLARRILRPLAAAAAVADRIAAGELHTPIPHGGADETGALLRSLQVMQTSVRDMMERETAQRRSAQARLVDALESSQEAMLLLDPEERIVIANSQVVRFFPWLADRLEEGAALGVLHARAPHGVDMTALLASGGEAPLPDGRWLRASRTATGDGGSFLFWTDITELKDREEKLRQATLAAEAASTAKTKFLANMSHELRTPLNGIIGFSELISAQSLGPVGDPRYADYAADILKSGRHLLAVLNSVLDLAKSETGKLQVNAEEVDLVEVLRHCRRIVADDARAAGLTLRFVGAEQETIVWGEAAKLRQAFLNLLSNAIKFSPPGGIIECVALRGAGETLRVEVRDTGIGMRAEDIPIALAPFGQIDSALARRYEGTGLGLPLSVALLALHGGSLTIDSAPGRGTTVIVNLDEALRQAAQSPLVAAAG